MKLSVDWQKFFNETIDTSHRVYKSDRVSNCFSKARYECPWPCLGQKSVWNYVYTTSATTVKIKFLEVDIFQATKIIIINTINLSLSYKRLIQHSSKKLSTLNTRIKRFNIREYNNLLILINNYSYKNIRFDKIRNLVNRPFLSTRVINLFHRRQEARALSSSDTRASDVWVEWTYREEAGRNSIESILALEGFLAWLRIIHQACSISRHPRSMELDGIGLRFSGRIHGVSVTLHRENPFRFDDSSALPTKQAERR